MVKYIYEQTRWSGKEGRMGSLGSPKTWIPYMNSKDCLQGFCSIYCPQWCYIISSPPPPVEFSDENPGPNFSPLVVAIIGILASAFLLVSYYTIISKYCDESNRSGRRENRNVNGELDDNLNLNLHEPWQASSNGVEEALINSIAVCKYKRGDGLVEITECSICLSEFEENEEFRLLPKCSHAFHLPCIDKWLKAHSNCPLCRANIFSLYSSLPLHSLTSTENPPSDEPNAETHLGDERESIENSSERQDSGDEIRQRDGVGELGNPKEGDVIIEISDGGFKPIRRSVSLDHPSRNRDWVARVLNSDRKDVEEIGSSKQPSEEGGEFKFSHKKWILDCVVSPVPMKRSFSSGRFLLTRHGRGSSVLPV